MDEHRHFTLIVAGEEPHKIIHRYDDHKVERYILFNFDKKDELYKKTLLMYENLSKQALEQNMKQLVSEHLTYLKGIDSMEYYLDITDGYDIDDNDGNVYSDENPNKKFDQISIGKNLSLPFKLKNGKESFVARKDEVDWELMKSPTEQYEIAWDTVMEGKKPETETEKTIYNNMRNRKGYFNAYGTRDNYILSNTSFWAFAFADENGWNELNDNESQFDWVKNFYSSFIEPLKSDTLLTVYECIRK